KARLTSLPLLIEILLMKFWPVSKNSLICRSLPLLIFGPQLSLIPSTDSPPRPCPYDVCSSGSTSGLSNIVDDEKSTEVVPHCPFLVVIRITPFAAWLP